MRDGFDPWSPTDRDACERREQLSDIVIDGGGTIDGAGWRWWSTCTFGHKPDCVRGQTVDIGHVKGLVLRDITVSNSPSWTVHLLESEDVLVERCRFLAPEWPHSLNTDGIDLDSVRRATIRNSYFQNGDDGVAIWAGAGPAVGAGASGISGATHSLPPQGPTRDVLVESCEFKHSHGLTVTEFIAGGVSNVMFRNITMRSVLAGPHIKAKRGNGGVVQNITFDGVTIQGTMREPLTRGWNGSGFALVIDMYTDCSGAQGGGGCPPDPLGPDATPVIKGVTVRDLRCVDSDLGGAAASDSSVCWGAAQLLGLPESPIQGLVLDGVDFGDPDCSLFAKNLSPAAWTNHLDPVWDIKLRSGYGRAGARVEADCFQCAFLDGASVGPGGVSPHPNHNDACKGL